MAGGATPFLTHYYTLLSWSHDTAKVGGRPRTPLHRFVAGPSAVWRRAGRRRPAALRVEIKPRFEPHRVPSALTSC